MDNQIKIQIIKTYKTRPHKLVKLGLKTICFNCVTFSITVKFNLIISSTLYPSQTYPNTQCSLFLQKEETTESSVKFS